MPPFTPSPVSAEAAALIEDTVHYITSLLPITPDTPLPDFARHYPLFDATHRELGAVLTGPWKESTSTIDRALVGEAGNVWRDGLDHAGKGAESLRRSAEDASHAGIHIASTIIKGALDISGLANRYLTTATSLLTGSMSIPILMGPIPLQPGTGILPALKAASTEARDEADNAADRINTELESDVVVLQRLLEEPSPTFRQCEVDITPDPPKPLTQSLPWPLQHPSLRMTQGQRRQGRPRHQGCQRPHRGLSWIPYQASTHRSPSHLRHLLHHRHRHMRLPVDPHPKHYKR